jgi:5-methylcytosine-specific restriction protein B
MTTYNSAPASHIANKYKEYSTLGRIVFVTFHPSYSYEEFIEGITVDVGQEDTPCKELQYKLKSGLFKTLCKRALGAALSLSEEEVDSASWKDVYGTYCERTDEINLHGAPKYVLIIDEINRGDIAKIFGELITLIEADKRIGESNELIVTLPTSRDHFGVPPNVYIVGTMNTADRSIALLDVALRRIFGFIEMNPDFDILVTEHIHKNKDILVNNNVYDLLMKSKEAAERINKTLCLDVAIGRDKQIGQSFFFKVYDPSDLRLVWKHEILPLMEEYCYSDYQKINRILFNRDSDTEWINKSSGIGEITDLDKMLNMILNNE